MPRPKRQPPAPDVMRQIVKWRFEEGKSNPEIARLLHGQGRLDNPKNVRHVAWALAESVKWLLRKDQRLLTNADSEEPLEGLRKQLRARFPHLREIRILPFEADYPKLMRQWGKAAAAYLDELIEERGVRHIGVSGGETILEVMSQLPDMPRPNVHFYAVALIGQCRLMESSHVSPEVNANIGWTRSGRHRGKCLYSSVSPYSTALAGYTPEERREAIKDHLDELSKNQLVKRFITDLDHIEVIFAGLGAVNPSGTNPAYANGDLDRLTMTGLLKPIGIDPNELVAQGAVGDLSYSFFNAEGREQPIGADRKPLPRECWRFFLGAGHYSEHSGIEFYRNAVQEGETRVVVIAGVHKETPLLAALRAELFNVWFTDEQTARKILAAK